MIAILILLCLGKVSPVMYSVDPDFKISLQQTPSQLAHCYYIEKIRESGWNRLHVYGSSSVDMIQQFRAAGFLEGYSTYKEIFYAYSNFYQSLVLNGQPNVNFKVKNFQDEQLAWLDYMYEQNNRDLYWRQAHALVEQLRYMYKGFVQRLHEEKRLDMMMTFSQFYYLTNMGDLEDIIPAYKQKSGLNSTSKMNCNSFTKEIDGKLYVTQSTFNIYNLMLRFWKVFDMPSKQSGIAARTYAFSSRPGDLESKDDYYMLSSGLAVTETSLNNYNDQNYKLLRPKCVPTWLRLSIANRLATTPSNWIDIFLRYRSYTHNNQWFITDLGRYDRTGKTEIMMVEEGFDIYNVANMTERFYKDGYLASYNVPIDLKIWTKLNYAQCKLLAQADGYDYENDPRGRIFKAYSQGMTDYESMKRLLRTNEQSDLADGIAPRYDLSRKLKFEFGMIDQKIGHQRSFQDNWIDGISCPPYNETMGIAPFDWRNWPKSPHMGMPDIWNFPWVQLPLDLQV